MVRYSYKWVSPSLRRNKDAATVKHLSHGWQESVPAIIAGLRRALSWVPIPGNEVDQVIALVLVLVILVVVVVAGKLGLLLYEPAPERCIIMRIVMKGQLAMPTASVKAT